MALPVPVPESCSASVTTSETVVPLGQAYELSPTSYDAANKTHEGTLRPSSVAAATTPSDSTTFQPEPTSRSKWYRCFSSMKAFLIDQWFLFGLGSVIVVASQVQVGEAQQSRKETVVTYLCVCMIFLITGLTLPTHVLAENYTRWKVHLFVQVQSFFLTSASIFGVVSLCTTNPDFLDPGLLVGMIFMGCVPTTISSNVVMTRQARGNQALTVVESTLGNFLGPFLTPALVRMYTASTGAWYTHILPSTGGKGFGELYRRVFMQLGLSLFLPLVSDIPCWPPCTHKQRGCLLVEHHADIIHLHDTQAVGQLCRNLFPNITKKVFIDWRLGKLSSLCLLVLIWQIFDQAFESRAFQTLKPSNVVFIVLISVCFYLLWTSICVFLSRLWLDKEDTIAVAYCVPAKTPAMGVPLSAILFSGLSLETKSKIQIPIVIYLGLQIAFGSLMTMAFRRWLHSKDKAVTDE